MSKYGDAFQNYLELVKVINRVTSQAESAVIHITKSVAPFVEFYIENQNKIDNFINSIDKVTAYYENINNIGLEKTFDIIDKLQEENKIQIDEDWKIEIVDKSTTKSKTNMPIDRILTVIGIAATIYAPSSTDTNLVNNSVTHIENHYHISDTNLPHNENVVMMDNVDIYADSDDKSDVIAKLKVGDVVNSVISENEKTLILVLDEDKNIKISGWIQSEYINSVVEN